MGGFFMLTQIVKNRAIWLLTLVALLVVLVTRFTLTPAQSFDLVGGFGYWFMFALVLVWIRAAARSGVWDWMRRNASRFDVWVLVLVIACTSIWWSHEKPGFKILADEVILAGTSMGMHFERSATYPIRATDVRGPFEILDRVLDKRPLLFPFLVATVHDLTGYRPDNAFYFNRGLGIAFLLLLYLLGWQLSGRRWAGVVGVLLFAGLPLAAQQSAGGGFELLNLSVLALLALSMLAYLRRPDAVRLELLVFTSLILVSCRYESIVLMLPMVLAVFLGWWRKQKISLSAVTMASPLFLVPWLLQNRIFSGDSTAWQMASKEGVSSPFGVEYVPNNLGHALAFFFDFSGYQASSAVFGALGILALPFFGIVLMKLVQKPLTSSPNDLATGMMGVGLFAISGILMLYFWGQFDDRIISRLSLPVHLLFFLAIVAVAHQQFKSDRGWQILAVLVALGAMSQSLPVMARGAYEIDYTPGLKTDLRREFLDAQLERDFIFIDHDSVFWIVHQIPASSVGMTRKNHEALAYHLKNHSYSAMYVFQTVLVNGQTGERYVDSEDDLGDRFRLETVWERKVQTLMFVRISRIVAIEIGDEVIAETQTVPLKTGILKSVEDVEEQRALYLENWIKQLP
jgi:hypothetical protein